MYRINTLVCVLQVRVVVFAIGVRSAYVGLYRQLSPTTLTFLLHFLLHFLLFSSIVGMSDRCFISESYDATSHFETVSDDVLAIYEAVTGEALDMNINADTTECDE